MAVSKLDMRIIRPTQTSFESVGEEIKLNLFLQREAEMSSKRNTYWICSESSQLPAVYIGSYNLRQHPVDRYLHKWLDMQQSAWQHLTWNINNTLESQLQIFGQII